MVANAMATRWSAFSSGPQTMFGWLSSMTRRSVVPDRGQPPMMIGGFDIATMTPTPHCRGATIADSESACLRRHKPTDSFLIRTQFYREWPHGADPIHCHRRRLHDGQPRARLHP